MVVHCVLSMPFGDEAIPVENSAEDQGVDDLVTAEHHSHGKYLFTAFMLSHIIMVYHTVILYYYNFINSIIT